MHRVCLNSTFLGVEAGHLDALGHLVHLTIYSNLMKILTIFQTSFPQVAACHYGYLMPFIAKDKLLNRPHHNFVRTRCKNVSFRISQNGYLFMVLNLFLNIFTTFPHKTLIYSDTFSLLFSSKKILREMSICIWHFC